MSEKQEVASISDQITEMEQRVEKFWHAEFQKQRETYETYRAEYIDILKKYQRFVGIIQHSTEQSLLEAQYTRRIGFPLPLLPPEGTPTDEFIDPSVVEFLIKELDTAADFRTMMTAINADDNMKDQWDKLCLFMRLAE